MSNKRELKHSINYICRNLFIECMASSLNSDDKSLGDIDAIATSILALNADAISRVSHPEPGMKPRAYYNDLKSAFNKQVIEIIDQIRAI